MNENDSLEVLVNDVIKTFKSKRNNLYKNIINTIKEIDESINLVNKNEMTHSSLMYQVKYYKHQFADYLKDAIETYQELIFKDFSFKNDVNGLINSASSLKMWLVRFLCLNSLFFEVDDLLIEDISNKSITKQYLEIDMILFKKVVNEKVASN